MLLKVGRAFVPLPVFRAGRHQVPSSRDRIRSVIKMLTSYVGFCVDKIPANFP